MCANRRALRDQALPEKQIPFGFVRSRSFAPLTPIALTCARGPYARVLRMTRFGGCKANGTTGDCLFLRGVATEPVDWFLIAFLRASLHRLGCILSSTHYHFSNAVSS